MTSIPRTIDEALEARFALGDSVTYSMQGGVYQCVVRNAAGDILSNGLALSRDLAAQCALYPLYYSAEPRPMATERYEGEITKVVRIGTEVPRYDTQKNQR